MIDYECFLLHLSIILQNSEKEITQGNEFPDNDAITSTNNKQLMVSEITVFVII